MDDAHQLEVPPSFTALYTRPGGYKLTEPMAVVRERYELCEDLAQLLTTQALQQLHALGITEWDVLRKMEEGLAVPGSPVQPMEARWVVRRLAELMGWEDPGPAADGGVPGEA